MLNEDTDRLIEMQIHRLDCFACEMESKWGIGNLIDYADDALKEKWYAQNKKLDDAVKNRNYGQVCQLVDGTIRGWEALEKAAIDAGKKPAEPEFMEVKLDSGFHLRIASSVSSARRASEKGVVCMSLGEVARLIEARYKDVYEVKKHIPDAIVESVSEPFDFDKGDEIPW